MYIYIYLFRNVIVCTQCTLNPVAALSLTRARAIYLSLFFYSLSLSFSRSSVSSKTNLPLYPSSTSSINPTLLQKRKGEIHGIVKMETEATAAVVVVATEVATTTRIVETTTSSPLAIQIFSSFQVGNKF